MSNSSERTMQYIRVQAAILSDQKFTDLLEYLEDKGEKFTRRDVFGSLGLLWVKAATHFNDGQIRDEHDLVRRVAKLCEWHGDSKVWTDALLHIHWIDKNEDGYYVHNWMEKHAREWWLKNESAEHKRQLARERAARFRNNRKRAAQQVQVLREKGIVPYDGSPPPPEESNAETALPTRDDALANVAHANEGVTNAGQESPLYDTAPPAAPSVIEPHSAIFDASQESLITNEVQEIGVTNALRGMTQRASRDKRREEREREHKDNGATEPNSGSLSPVQALVKLWFDLFKAAAGQKATVRGGYLGTVFGRLEKRGYPAAVIEVRVRNFFASTYTKIKDKNFPASMFEQKFDELAAGPILEWEKNRRKEHGEFDKPPEQFQTTDDFS